MAEQVEYTELFRRQSLRVNVIRACKQCGAPGYWHDIEGVNPACYDPAKKQLAEANHEGFAPIGPICPQCGADREDDVENLGEVWSKEFRAPSTWQRVKRAIKEVWK